MLKAITLIGVQYIVESIVGICKANQELLDWENYSKEKLAIIVGNIGLREYHIQRMNKMRAEVEAMRQKGEEIPRCGHKRGHLTTGCLSCFSRSFALNPASNNWDFMIATDLLPDNVAFHSHKKFNFFCIDDLHSYQTSPDSVSRGRGFTTGCPFCASKELCDDFLCKKCNEKSYQSHKKSDYWLQDKNGGVTPRQVFLNSHNEFWHKCDVCQHDFEIAPDLVNNNHWCGFCSNMRRCEEEKCEHCFNNSFASHYHANHWDYEKNGDVKPRDVAKCSNKQYYFICETCDHSFKMSLDTITLRDGWCPFCSNNKLCPDEKCHLCYDKSFANHYRANSWDYKKNKKVSPRDVFKTSNIQYYFICETCEHSFKMSLDCISLQNQWCPFCNGGKLCLNNCIICYNLSYSSIPNSEFWNYNKNGSIIPRYIRKRCNTKYYHNCNRCKHELYISPDKVTIGQWCMYCIGRVCGKDDCKLCDKACIICQTRKAKRITKKTKKFVCDECYERCSKEDPSEISISNRSKLTLEIYCLAELQRLSLQTENSFLITECTSWDCAILPGLSFKPDNIWVFDSYNNVFQTAGACKINMNKVSYILVLEILECSIAIHSKTRSISDKRREKEIRKTLSPIPVGFVYCTVAHNKHSNASLDDIFFTKNTNGEYEIIKGREEVWLARINLVREKLIEFYVNKSDATFYIGN